jgi:hypothetical protein
LGVRSGGGARGIVGRGTNGYDGTRGTLTGGCGSSLDGGNQGGRSDLDDCRGDGDNVKDRGRGESP